MKKILIAVSMMVSIVIGGVLPAMADYAVTCVVNKTGRHINFDYRWENETEWKSTGTPLGGYFAMSWNYDKDVTRTDGQSPALVLRVDADLTENNDWRIHNLARYRSSIQHDCAQGKIYAWIISNGTRLQLKALD